MPKGEPVSLADQLATIDRLLDRYSTRLRDYPNGKLLEDLLHLHAIRKSVIRAEALERLVFELGRGKQVAKWQLEQRIARAVDLVVMELAMDKKSPR